MPKTTEKETIKVKINIRPGPTSPAICRAWVTFWKRIIAVTYREVSQ